MKSIHANPFPKIWLVGFICFISCKNLSQVQQPNEFEHTNHLIHETSPYLLQHAHNPVDWHPWGEKALTKARKENKLLIISIGYAACHWCHVMEHESFEDSTVAAIMNEHFVSIKVDREERPDVDDVYMSAAQLVSGRGGWPLNVFALPDGKPIWAGTYFPRDRWISVLNQFAELKTNDYARLESSAQQLTSGINNLDVVVMIEDDSEYNTDDHTDLAKTFVKQVDMRRGGRKGAPKFPMPNNYEWLLKYAYSSKDLKAREAVFTTLDKMALGGIYDQIGGGFARYSVDDIWKVPHFEKMLYDNGQLVSLYSQAYEWTQNPLYKKVIVQSLEFVNRELTSPDGAFYSSLDADSEGEEGKFYVWTDDEIDRILNNEDDALLFKRFYSVTRDGNWEHGQNILNVSEDPKKLADHFNLTTVQLNEKIGELNQLFLVERRHRIRPGLDDKVLTSWNALMLKGYISAYRALGDTEYLKKAKISADFLMSHQVTKDFRVNRNYKDGRSTINGFLDDYANLIDAFLALYEVTFDERWIEISKGMTSYVITHFFEEESGMFNYTSDLDPPLIARKLELSDNVIPASNSIMARNLKKLGELTYDRDLLTKSEQMLKNMLPNLLNSTQPGFYSNWLQLFFDFVHPPFEVAVVGPDALKVTRELMGHYSSNAIFIGSEGSSTLPLLEDKYMEGKTMIYVCQNKVCKLPVSQPEQALEIMRRTE